VTAGAQADPIEEELRDRLRRWTPERHPLKHATTQFHLGSVLLDRDDHEGAELAFATASALFRLRGARPEEAKALNGLGATLRAAGRLDLATQALGHAAAGLAAAGLPLEEGAAHFNLGLVLRDRGEPAHAQTAFARAVELLDPAQVPAQASAALRELAATRLQHGDAEGAEASFAAAMALADRAADEAARGAAANGLGLARLAADRPADAVLPLRTAVAANPRALRPHAFAMAQANLATALERTGDGPGARLAARQAAAVPGVPAPVAQQVAGVLERLGRDEADLAAVLAAASLDERGAIAREEVARAAVAPHAADARDWVVAHAAWSGDPAEVAELWLGAVLELPAAALEPMVRSLVEATVAAGAEDRETVRSATSRAMSRFHVPQMLRLQEVFGDAARDLGDPEPWR
jgi:tetratricopeptide (TPR) repeat protein